MTEKINNFDIILTDSKYEKLRVNALREGIIYHYGITADDELKPCSELNCTSDCEFAYGGKYNYGDCGMSCEAWLKREAKECAD